MLGKYRGGTAGFPFMRIPRFPSSPHGCYKEPGAAGPPCLLSVHRGLQGDATSFMPGSEVPCASGDLSAWGQVDRKGGSQEAELYTEHKETTLNCV